MVLIHPFFTKGVILGHDTHWHLLVSQENLYHFNNGDLWSLWLSRVNSGFGAFNLYPPLFSVLVLVASMFTDGEVTRQTLGYAVGFCIIAAAFSSFTLFRYFSGYSVSVLGSFLYVSSPYLYAINFFERGALAEAAASIFYPLFFLGILNLKADSR